MMSIYSYARVNYNGGSCYIKKKNLCNGTLECMVHLTMKQQIHCFTIILLWISFD